MTKFSLLHPAKGRLFKAASVPLLLASLAACASPFSADVSRFRTQLPAPQGQTFAVVAEDPALQGGLEFSQYANYVADEMQRLGYTRAASPETANLIVQFDYGVDNGRERVRSTGLNDPFYDPWYGYSPYYRRRFYGGWGYGFYDPWLAPGPDIRSYTVYNSDIELKIDNRATGQRLFEGRAEAVSTSKRLQYLVPNLVEAMFTDFPGDSGETVRITVKPEDGGRR
ncbi:DUF4136 domain-containing protein [Erythrobacter sp. LQ02-29]|uniref:DUF4136 domain-containing protein n=1 Tax=unclassified Erythrobacter TaxID=2633097 RepID=UPI001BFC36EB|nr:MULTISPECIES: DUF4136 domain-containing protein [unclassified Erythrobacter]MCP9221657.1 DUF4136 domain-containing protein [Erythrobacter sp. LQ02-29]QWC57084.1 DUF4136 domain-containing protein [Erythrobacter sp. 3-20A1M]